MDVVSFVVLSLNFFCVYVVVIVVYWVFMLLDGVLWMLVFLYFNSLGFMLI